MTEYAPDSWVVIKIKQEDDSVEYKILGGWSGGYLDGDSWRMNSGIEKMDYDGRYYHFTGYSGSVYVCHKQGEHLSMATMGVWGQLAEKFADNVEIVDVGDIKLSA